MPSDIAVDVVDVSKKFRLYHQKRHSLKERVLHPGANPYEEFLALDDVSFEVTEGETVGILGRNGSGKSTLLKCMSGILQPTEGKIVVRGSLAALLELGAGFQPELSGRENIYLNGSLLGLSTKEVERRFDDIVAFAELEHFIDNQVKYYSSGMYVRLGFAVAVNVEPDVLVVDEVLAVGDENFQRKCIGRIKEFQNDGRTILFVTHSADQVRTICDRAAVLSSGEMLGYTSAAEAVKLYHDHLLTLAPEAAIATAQEFPEVPAYRPVTIGSLALEHPGTGTRNYLLPGEPLTIHLGFEAIEPVPDAVIAVEFHDSNGELVFASDSEIGGRTFDLPAGPSRADVRFEHIPFLDGTYTVAVAVRSRLDLVYDRREMVSFEVMNPGRSRGTVALDMQVEVGTPA
ncbi:MAG TPA: ABC transporter ATP-binding protein [Acidimicrobiales bacterium]|nr:ABC transporter ATP-binding protein [Acidimicrobiales bacterium]